MWMTNLCLWEQKFVNKKKIICYLNEVVIQITSPFFPDRGQTKPKPSNSNYSTINKISQLDIKI